MLSSTREHDEESITPGKPQHALEVGPWGIDIRRWPQAGREIFTNNFDLEIRETSCSTVAKGPAFAPVSWYQEITSWRMDLRFYRSTRKTFFYSPAIWSDFWYSELQLNKFMNFSRLWDEMYLSKFFSPGEGIFSGIFISSMKSSKEIAIFRGSKVDGPLKKSLSLTLNSLYSEIIYPT